MAEPETQTEDETNEILREVKTDITGTDVMEDATIESGDQISTDYESETNEDITKKRSWLYKRWADEKKSYAKSQLMPEMKDERKIDTVDVDTTFPLRKCFPLGGFQLEHRTRMTVGSSDRRRRTRIWRSMKARQPTRIFRKTGRISRNGKEKSWPNVWQEIQMGLETGEKEGWTKRRDISPHDPSENEFLLREQKNDFASCKELGYARAPIPYSPVDKQKLMVDRTIGKCPGLVNGDYTIVRLPIDRVYANVILHGTKGMHLLEMSEMRERRYTWKFCFYQAVVALLAKTQLRYKYAWSANIDYIYDHAWMLFTHIGTINVKAKHRLDDVVVYNYKYSVEIELIEEMNNVAADDVLNDYEERDMGTEITLSRKDPLQVRTELDCRKVTDSGYRSTHKDVKEVEEWLGKLTAQYRECILRTNRFSLAFWKDGLFWYLYNPYRCNAFGLWDDIGRACIVKFCSVDSLRRHLMILVLRGHSCEVMLSRLENFSEYSEDNNVYFDIQIFRVSFHCCQLDNLKLLQRGVSNKQPRHVDNRLSDSLVIEDQEDETDREVDEEDDQREPRERATWLKRYRATTTWGKYTPAKRKRPDSTEITVVDKARWHQYYVEEPNRLFSLWGEIHITDGMFDKANRGMQAYACYMVCAGMTMITAPEYWSPKTLDAIVICGDRYYTRSRHEAVGGGYASRSFKCLSDRFEIGKILFEARMLPAVRGRLYAKSSECLWRTLERLLSNYHFAVLTCESVCLGLFKFCGAYYMCDVNSFGPPLFPYGHGAAYLLRATSFRKFVTVLVLTVSSPERSRFSLNPIEILRIVEMDAALEPRAKTRERRHPFGRFVGNAPGKSLRSALDRQKKKEMKK